MTALYHAYSQTVADGTATSVVRPSDWNSAHIQNQTIAGNTAGVSSFSGTNIVFQGGNNVTLSANTAANAATIIISGANTVAQTVQTQASGAIAGTGFTSTTTTGTNITAAMGSNGLSMAVPAFLTTSSQSVQTQASGAIAGTGFTSTTTAGTNITAAMGSNGLSMAVPAYITTYAAQTVDTNKAGTGTTLALTNLTGTLAANTNGVALSLSANSGGAGPVLSYYDLYELGDNNVYSAYGLNSVHVQLFYPGADLSITAVNMLASLSSSGGNASLVAAHTFSYGVYSIGAGTNSSRLESMATSSFFLNGYISTNNRASYAVGQGTNSFTTSASSTSINTVLSGVKAMQFPFATSLDATGVYAMVFFHSSATTGATIPLRVSFMVNTVASGASASFGQINTGGVSASATSITQEFQQLIWSTTTNALPSTIAFSDLSNNGASVNHMFAYFNA